MAPMDKRIVDYYLIRKEATSSRCLVNLENEVFTELNRGIFFSQQANMDVRSNTKGKMWNIMRLNEGIANGIFAEVNKLI